MKTKERARHTPGPWKISGKDINESSHRMWTVARVYGMFLGKGIQKANSRLIAASPELLDACKLALQWDPDGDVPLIESHNALRIAIAKAEVQS